MLITVFKSFIDKQGVDAAAILSFTTLFALIPALALGLSVFSLSPYFADLQQYLEQFMFEQLLPQNYDLVKAQIQNFVTQAQTLKGFSSVFLLLAVIFLLQKIDKCINLVWDCGQRRYWLRSIISYLFILFVGPILIATSLFAGTYVMHLKFISELPISPYTSTLLVLFLSSLGLAILYYATPVKKVRFLNALKAGVITTIGLNLIKYAMIIYIQYFPIYELIYGTLSLLMLAMLWVYLSWMVVLLGANFCYYFEKHTKY